MKDLWIEAQQRLEAEVAAAAEAVNKLDYERVIGHARVMVSLAVEAATDRGPLPLTEDVS